MVTTAMTDADRWFERKHFVEDTSLLLEENGVPRMAGRILGWLLICDPPFQSIDDLAVVLQASKGSISTMTRYLIQLDQVERIGIPGKRRDYYRLKDGSWMPLFRQQVSMVTSLRQLMERGLALLSSEGGRSPDRMREVRDLCAYFEKELPALIDRWERQHKLA